MTTVAALVEETRELLHGTYRAAYNTLAVAIDADDTSLTFNHDLGLIETGSLLSVGAETMLVVDTTTAGAVTVVRGFLSSTAAAHDADALVEVNPRFTGNAIRRALLQEVRSWGPTLWRVESKSLSVGATSRSVDLDESGEVYRLLRCRRSPKDTVAGTWPDAPVTLEKGLPTGTFPSGQGLFVLEAIGEAVTLQVTLARPFVTTAWADATDVEATVGLSANMLDIPPLGAAARLLAGADIRRTDTEAQGEYRRDEAVPAGAASQIAARLRREADNRLATEANRLGALWGWNGNA